MNNKNGIPAFIFRVMSETANRLSGVAVLCMIILIVTEVILRKFFNTSTTICDEYTGYFQVAIIFLSLAQCFRENRHINVDLIVRRLPASLKRKIETINDLIALIFVSVALWASAKLTLESFMFGSTSYGPSNTLLFIPQLVVVIGVFIFFLQILFNLVKRYSLPPEA